MKQNKRNHGLIIGNMVLTNMTAVEVEKLSRIMAPAPREDSAAHNISLAEYIVKHSPEVVRWVSKNGTEMVRVQIMHDVIDEREDWIEQPAFHADGKLLRLQKDN